MEVVVVVTAVVWSHIVDTGSDVISQLMLIVADEKSRDVFTVGVVFTAPLKCRN